MQFQKTTVLDAARISEELKSFKNRRIKTAYSGFSGKVLYLEFLATEQILKYSLGSDTSYIGIVNNLPDRYEKSLAGIEDYGIVGIRQVNNDRIIEFELEKKDRLEKSVGARLIFELIPNSGDVYFTDIDSKIKSTLRKKRKKIYGYPDPLKKPTILNVTEKHLIEFLEKNCDPFAEIYGLNPRDIQNLAGTDSNDIHGLLHDLAEYAKEAVKPGPAWIITRDDEYAGYSLVKPALSPDETAQEFESALLMYEQYYSSVSGNVDEKKRIDQLTKTVKSEITKKRVKISRITKQLEESEKAELYRTFGEMILSNIGRIKKGAGSVTLDSNYDNDKNKIVIKLDPSKTAAANAEFYFKKSRKAAGSKTTLKDRLADSESELNVLEKIADLIDNDPDSAERRLIEAGILADPDSKNGSKKIVEPRKPYRRFRATCGWEILVGKSNKDNDELTFHIASKDDYWFHAWQAAGSHTVLRLPDKSSKPDKQTLLEAASLAAYFSKAKHSSKVPVLYTQAKYVRKPRKFPPGKVLVEREKQLMVKPADPDHFLPKE